MTPFSTRLIHAALALVTPVCLAGMASAQPVYITEFMASNSSFIADDDGDFSDWLELHNAGAQPVNLDGWFLSDNANNKQKWRIPAIVLSPGEHRVIWASNKNRTNPAAPLHTNFALSADGEYLGLTRPNGITVEFQYAPTFPAQQSNVSYGISTDAPGVTMVTPQSNARAFVPINGTLGTTWTAWNYSVPAAWLSGLAAVGFETGTGYENLISIDVRTQMHTRNSTCYIRVPFTLAQIPEFDRLTLRMKYDDGFIAYINGVRVASANAPAMPAWSSAATQSNPDEAAVLFEDFDVAPMGAGALRVGDNVLAIHGLNRTASNADFLIIPLLEAVSNGDYQPSQYRFFTQPTPGAFNGATAADRGPVISLPAHTPQAPAATDAIVVTALVQPGAAPVSAVTLRYRVNYGPEVAIPMLDDGASGDGDADDGVFGATIPANIGLPGQMIRWYISATDTASNTGRLPIFASPTQSPEYLGTMYAAPDVTSQLPILHWWVQSAAAAATDSGTRCSLFFQGEFYDNVYVRLRGQSSSGWPKPHYKFDFNKGFYFRASPDFPPVEEFNLQSTYSDKAYIRQVLSWETYRDSGTTYSEAFPWRIQQNGEFHSVAIFVEQVDDEMLSRNGLDNDGALYKMFNTGTSATSSVEKKTRQNEPNDDLAAFLAGINAESGVSHTRFLFDHVDIPAVINYIAATTLIHDNDHVGKNYYLFRDTEGSGEWRVIPWDKDLTFGRNFGAGGGVLSDGIWASTDPYSHPLFGDRDHPKIDGPWNRVIDSVHREPTIRQMYLRRLRSLMDSLLQPPATPYNQRRYEARADELRNLMNPDVLLDRARWGNPYGTNQSFDVALNALKNQYLEPRRNHLFVTHSSSPSGIIPAAQSPAPTIIFGSLDRSPISGDQEDEFLELINPMAEAVDVSGWKLTGDIRHTFSPGTVIPAGASLFVTPNTVKFRARAVSPTGGEGRFIQGNYSGRLADPPQPLFLEDASGRIVASITRCPADFNQDGGVDGDDITAFLLAWEAADNSADVNGDGGIDGGDVETFFLAWEAGGCE
ncbi:MAG: CotH kinase family protein [Phycisphaeraceae bacterium]|nr:CotH kinase family protein [Phycisphaeraceae bacterium]